MSHDDQPAFETSLPSGLTPMQAFTLMARRCSAVVEHHRRTMRYGHNICTACGDVFPCYTRRIVLGELDQRLHVANGEPEAHTPNGSPEPGPYGPGTRGDLA